MKDSQINKKTMSKVPPCNVCLNYREIPLGILIIVYYSKFLVTMLVFVRLVTVLIPQFTANVMVKTW